jgi:putative transposase
MLTGRRYRLELTEPQTEYAEQIGAVCRVVWNTGLHQRREYRRRGGWMNYTPQCGELAEAKRDHSWLGEVPGHCLQQALKDLDRACREHGTFRVNWRSKRGWSPSFRFPEGGKIVVERLGRKAGRVKLPKFGWVRFRWSRQLGGMIRSATLSRDGGHWFVSFLVEDDQTTPNEPVATGTVGLDRGVVAAVATSDGAMHDREFSSPGEAERYRRLQQQLARQAKGSANRRRTLEAMRRVKGRERDRRQDFTTQLGSALARTNGLVAVEALNTRGMTSSGKGTVEQPGSRVRAKAGLNRAILDKGWHKLLLALRSTARYTGTRIVEVPAAYTSQACSACRSVDAASRESQARFRCTRCGFQANADINAARNVLAAGLAVTACGDLAVGRSVKQEPAETRKVVPLPDAA